VRVDGRYQTTENPVLVPGPDSNRHGVSSEGFSYPLQLSLLSPLISSRAHLESGLSLCRALAARLRLQRL